MTNDERVRQLNDSAVRHLIDAHKKRSDEPIVLAIRYRLDDPVDVYLMEAIANFPGGDDDELLTTEFEPSAQLRILGKLVLALGSPAQVQAAVRRGDALIRALGFSRRLAICALRRLCSTSQNQCKRGILVATSRQCARRL